MSVPEFEDLLSEGFDSHGEHCGNSEQSRKIAPPPDDEQQLQGAPRSATSIVEDADVIQGSWLRRKMLPCQLAEAAGDRHHQGALTDGGEDGDERVGLDGEMPVL